MDVIRPVALTIAGSDSGGGAGIQADLRTFSALGALGTTAVTAVTAQNLQGVRAVEGLPPALVQSQLRAVLQGFEVRAAKTGMLWSAATIEAVSEVWSRHAPAPGCPLVVDPVMVAASGDPLLQPEAVAAYRRRLAPLCTLLTPNLDEAALLLGRDTVAAGELEQTARRLGLELGCPVLLKGGHLEGDPRDVLWHLGELTCWEHPRIDGVSTHGLGCILSAAITALLARGEPLVAACEQALGFLQAALTRPLRLSSGTALADIEGAPAGLADLRQAGS
jgi:hydroxymethylpyrimidine/phosphomethylpyrimidine kinase